MKKNIYALILIFLILINQAIACTTFTAVKDGAVFLAGNEDQTSNNSYLVIDPTGKYGVVFFATPTADLPLVMQMGINEMGVSYDIDAIWGETLDHIPNAIPQKEWALVKLMRETASVNELLDKIFTYDWGTSIAYQIHIADKFGDAAVIHPGQDGRLTYTRIDKNKGYLVSANFNIRDTAFNSYFSGRYKTADKELKEIFSGKKLSKELMTSILEKTHQDKGYIDPTRSIFSVIFNLTTLEITFYYENKFNQPYLINVTQELSKTHEKKIISIPEVMASIKKYK